MCGDSNPGYRSAPRNSPGPYTGRSGGGSTKWPMVRAFVVLAMALSGMATRHGKRAPRGEPSGCN